MKGRTAGAGGPRGRGRRFSAAAGPHGIHLVEYRRSRGGVEVLAGVRRAVEGTDPQRLGLSLAEAVESLGGRGGTLELGLSGFGSAHHILPLPMASRDVLEPVVRRELLRYYPDLRDPVVGFTEGPEVEPGDGPRRELLVGAVPRELAETLHRVLAAREITLSHLTILPRALQGVYDTFDGGEPPAVAVLLLETGPLIGCFQTGALRLYIEPPLDIHGRPVRAAKAVADQVSRATLFLRQQFPGTGPARVLLATPEGETADVQSALRTETQGVVERLGELPAGSLAALGAALDAGSDAPLQLLPGRLRPRGPAELWTRRLAGAATAILVGAAMWWAGSAVMVARAQAAEAQAAEAQVSARVPWLVEATETLDARRAHAMRVEFLDRTVASRDEVGRILAAVAAVAPPSVRLEAAHLSREEDGAWRLILAGIATGPTGAAAVRAVDALYRGLPGSLPVTEVELGELEGVGEGDGPVALAFDMSFIVRWERDLQR